MLCVIRWFLIVSVLLVESAFAQNLSQGQWLWVQRTVTPNAYQVTNGSVTSPPYSFSTNTSTGLWYDPSSTDFLTINGGNAPAGTDVAGVGILVKPGPGRGNASGGDYVAYCAPPAASGSSLNTQQAIIQYSCTGANAGRVTVGGIDVLVAGGETDLLGVDVAAGVSNTAGGDVVLSTGLGTGDAPSPHVFIDTATVGSSGTTQQSRGVRWDITQATSKVNNRFQIEGDAPTVSSCGTGPTIVGNDQAGKVTAGTGATLQSCILTFAGGAFSSAPACVVNDESQILVVRGVSTTTTLTIDCAVAGCLESDVVSYVCMHGT